MLKTAGFGLLGLAALMVIPSGVSADVAPMMYGAANIEMRDGEGNVKLLQTVHNQLTDEGEEFLVDQVFDTGDAAETGDSRVDEICIVSDNSTAYSETTTLPDHDSNIMVMDQVAFNFRQVCAGTVTDNGSSAQIGPVTFTSGADFNTGQTVGGFLVCTVGSAGGGGSCNAGFNTFASGYAFAVVDINDVALPANGDSLTITYTFDVTTPNT